MTKTVFAKFLTPGIKINNYILKYKKSSKHPILEDDHRPPKDSYTHKTLEAGNKTEHLPSSHLVQDINNSFEPLFYYTENIYWFKLSLCIIRVRPHDLYTVVN